VPRQNAARSFLLKKPPRQPQRSIAWCCPHPSPCARTQHASQLLHEVEASHKSAHTVASHRFTPAATGPPQSNQSPPASAQPAPPQHPRFQPTIDPRNPARARQPRRCPSRPVPKMADALDQFSPAPTMINTACFERARLQSCRKRGRICRALAPDAGAELSDQSSPLSSKCALRHANPT